MNQTLVALTLFLLQPDMAGQGRSHYEIATYDSRTECDIAARTVRIHTRGARVRCLLLAPEEVRARQAAAAAVSARQNARERSRESLLGSELATVLP